MGRASLWMVASWCKWLTWLVALHAIWRLWPLWLLALAAELVDSLNIRVSGVSQVLVLLGLHFAKYPLDV